MDCFYCLSVWVAVPASLTLSRRGRDLPLVALALSGAACLLERATAERSAPGAATFETGPGAATFDTRGDIDELLWQEAESV
jgi:hypothetical protein